MVPLRVLAGRFGALGVCGQAKLSTNLLKVIGGTGFSNPYRIHETLDINPKTGRHCTWLMTP